MKRRNFLLGTAAIAATGGALAVSYRTGHLGRVFPVFAQGAGVKPATEFTKAVNKAMLDSLPFTDRQDFDDARRGFIAGPPGGVVKDLQGKVLFDAKNFELPLDAPAPEWMNPSLWRMAQLNGLAGLFQVSDRIYQVRNIDVANITFIEGDTGVIVVDTTASPDSARTAVELYFANRPRKPIVAVVFTHSHIDHFGGVRGVVSAEDVAAGKVKLIAPAGFTEESVSENLYAGNAMLRRSTYQYGMLLKKGPGADQALGSGLGVTGPDSAATFLVPTDFVTKTGQKMTVDGLEFEFLMAPGSEAPSEMHFFIRPLKALCTAENAVHTLHNFYTLRGAKTRDVAKWIGYLDDTLEMWGDEAEVLYAPHNWPKWGNGAVRAHIEKYRDAFKYIHDQSLRLANHGYTLPEIGDMVQMPPSLAGNWATRGYYGTVSHDARAVYNFYLGYFTGNPAELNPLPPVAAAPRYVEYMGGAPRVIEMAQKAYDAGDYRWVAQVLEHVVYAEPTNQDARNLQADAFEQLAYQSEAATWRNIYTVGAKELREGVAKPPVSIAALPDMMTNVPIEMLFDYLGIKLNGPKAAGKTITVNIALTDTGQQYALMLQNGVLNYRPKLSDKPDVALTLSRADLNAALLGAAKLDQQIADGKVKLEGRREALGELFALMDDFEFWFDVITRPKMA
ncbi:MAG: MBL fold metallo-hydrolase [Alphaproteobacteria bacterium]|nr:MBL fold metallo-hydrolase [Alphaproteobacteria bacterium]